MYKLSPVMNAMVEEYLGVNHAQVIHRDGRSLTPEKDAKVKDKDLVRGSIRIISERFRTSNNIEAKRSGVLNKRT